MDDAMAQILPAGNLRLLPGVAYRVIRQFTDEDDHVHPVGERWRFLGFEERTLAGGYTLYCSDSDGVERKLRLNYRRLVTDPKLPLDHFEDFVAGPSVESTTLVAKLSSEARAAFERLQQQLGPLPTMSGEFIQRLDQIRPHPKAEEDGPSQRTADIWVLQHEIYQLLADEAA